MSDDRVAATIAAARSRLGLAPGLATARAHFDEVAESMATRMRVALVGRVSAGKSTLANALLGGYRAPTGVNELTYNVNWISHGTRPSVTVHFTDGRPAEPRDITELEKLTVRVEDDSDPAAAEWKRYLAGIAYLRITDPAPYLQAFDLVDTPGLDSVFGADSANTLRFLNGPMDAIVLVFARSMHASEPQLLRRLQGSSLSTGPINTIAALTRVEDHWEWPDTPDPHRVARRVVEQAQSAAGVAGVIYRLCPVASLVGATAAVLTDSDLADLQLLARLSPDRLGYWLDSAEGFTARDAHDVDVSPPRRTTLYQALSGYGIMLACEVLREGADDVATLRRELDRRSGMAEFRQLLVDHFGNRAELIKLNRAYARMQAMPDELGAGLDPRDRGALIDAVREFTRFGLAQSAQFRELEVLRAYYDKRLELSPSDGAELLRITGEHGPSPAARLGLPHHATAEELTERARHGLRHWAELDVGAGFAGTTRLAVAVGRRAYERLIGELDDVQRDERWR